MPAVREAKILSARLPLGDQIAATTPTPQTTALPIGVIAGCLAGGVVLAIAIVLTWSYWGKYFHWQRRSQACTMFTTRDKTRRRSSYRVHKKKHRDSFIQKLFFDLKSSDDISNEKASAYDGRPNGWTADVVEPFSPALSTASLVPSRPIKLLPTPRMLRKHGRQVQAADMVPTLSPIIDVNVEERDPTVCSPLLDAPILSPLPTLIHKPSTIGSSSVYSTQSGEERQFDISQNFLLNGRGDSPITRPPLAISHKPSNVSSVYSNQSGEERMFGVTPNFLRALGQDRRRLSTWTHSSGSMCSIADERPPSSAWIIHRARNAGGGADGPQSSRLSQISCATISIRLDTQLIVGIAYGGENEEEETEVKSKTDWIL